MQTALITFLVDQEIDGSTKHHRAGESITGQLLERKGTFILVAVNKQILFFDTARSDLFRLDVYNRPQTA
jgi:hypothetical protein